MKNKRLILLFISCCFILFLCSADTMRAEAETEGKDRLYLYQEDTQTLVIKGIGADTAEEIADGYRLISYDYARLEALVKYGIVGAGVTKLTHEDTCLFRDAETLVIGDSVTDLGSQTFGGCDRLKSITFGDGVTTLPRLLFYIEFACTELETVILGKSIRTMEDYAFYDCSGLKNIVLDPENPYFKIEKKGLYSKDGKKLYAYPVAADGEPVIVPGTREIAPDVFAYSHMTSIEIPASVKALSGGLFHHCEQLKKLTFAENSQCVRTETSIVWGDDLDTNGIFAYCTQLKEVRFGENFKQLAEDTFNKSAVRSIYLGKSFRGTVKSGKVCKMFAWYGEWTHSVFSAVEKIEVSKQNKYYKVKKGALLSKDGKKLYAYPGGRKNRSYTVPASVEIIAEHAFCSQMYLRKVHTGKNTKIVGICAFNECMELKKVSLGKKTKTIKSGAFESCYKLSVIVGLEKVKKIGEDALWKTNIIYMPRWDANRNPPIARGDVMYIYMAAGSEKTTWSVTKGDKRVKILKRYKNSNRIKVKVKKKGYVVIQARQGSKKTECDFNISY